MSDKLAIDVRGLRRVFSGYEALRGVNLQVPRGSIFGLVGPNGAGKTTTFSVLCGFLHPTAGEVKVLGRDPRDRASLGARVGALPQDAPLPQRLSVRQALTYWSELGGRTPDAAVREADEWLARVGLTDHAQKTGAELSHGMAKRIALAQAFLCDPELVLLDEPTSGLDPRTAFEVEQLIRDEGGKRTIVISSHDIAQIEELCTGVAIIDRGVVVSQGSLADVTGQGSVVRIELADDPTPPVLEALGKLDCVKEHRVDAAGRALEVQLVKRPPEEAIPAVLTAVLAAGGRVVGVVRGVRLEKRLLELT